MSDAILVAIISGVCTMLGSCGGVLASQSLTQYRLKKLEEKVEKHNSVIERTFKLEGRMNEAEHDLKDLKQYHHPH